MKGCVSGCERRESSRRINAYTVCPGTLYCYHKEYSHWPRQYKGIIRHSSPINAELDHFTAILNLKIPGQLFRRSRVTMLHFARQEGQIKLFGRSFAGQTCEMDGKSIGSRAAPSSKRANPCRFSTQIPCASPIPVSN